MSDRESPSILRSLRRRLFRSGAAGPVLWLLVFDKAFRTLLIASGILAAALFMGWLKLWPVHSARQSTIRVSLFDMAHAAVLNRTADRLLAQGDPGSAVRTWRRAYNKFPGSNAPLRRILTCDSAGILADRELMLACGRALVAEAQPSALDIRLAARAFSAADQFGEFAAALRDISPPVPLPALEQYFNWLLRSKEWDLFASEWERLAGSSAPSLHVIWLGYQALSGGPDAAAAETQLKGALLESNAGEAARLLLDLYSARADLANHEAMLEIGGPLGVVTAADHARYWISLKNAGRMDRAVELAAASRLAPATAHEAMSAAEALDALGLTLPAVDLLEVHAEMFGSRRYWELLAKYLIAQKDWERLARAAVRMRLHETAGHQLQAYGLYLEALASRETGFPARAQTALSALSQANPADVDQALKISAELLNWNRADVALAILSQVEPDAGQDPQFWKLMSKAAQQAGQNELHLRAEGRLSTSGSPETRGEPLRAE